MTKTFTLGELLDAIEKNGLPVERGGTYFRGIPLPNTLTPYSVDGTKALNSITYIDKIVGACALGQAAINLGIEPYFAVEDATVSDIISEIITTNDDSDFSLPELANLFRNKWGNWLNYPITAEERDYSGLLDAKV